MKVAGCNGRRQKMYRRGRSPNSSKQNGQKNIWSLPEELLLHLLKGLHITDLLNMRSTHPTFRTLIDNHPVVWTTACFKNAWPTLANMKHINTAADHGNIEALIKLGIAYLYNEGLPSDFQGRKVSTNGERAAEMFCKVETLLPNVTPFTWLFIRPPWATSGACCKECVFKNMKSFTETHVAPNVTVCIAKTLQLLEEEGQQQEAVQHLEQATAAGSPHAAFLLWQHRYAKNKLDPAAELEAIRKLRNLVKLGDPDAVLQLCRFYAQKKYGGLSEVQAASYMRNFIRTSKPNHIEEIYRQSELTHSMRYILVDWLVEVAGMKDFGSPTLHAAISVVDRFLRFHRTSRARFQLLGVAAMVLCSRFLGKDIITIREAAWLTDNTYKYEDVVRMMGEIMATLRGRIRVLCSLDYVQLIGLLATNEPATQCLAEYVCELALLQSDLGPYPQAEIAAGAVLLARLSHKQDFPWPQQMMQFTGYCVSDLAKCTMNILEKCFLEGAMMDHRAVVLQAVKERYADAQFFEVSKMKMPTAEDLRALLGTHQAAAASVDLRLELNTMPHLIMSPSRNKHGHANRPCQMSVEREQAATPTLESMEKSLEALFNDSHLSGYEGDLEDELESCMDEESEAETSMCLDDTHSSVLTSQTPRSSFDSSGWFGSDTSFSAFSPQPAARRNPISASTPSIRINLPSFGYIGSSPIGGYAPPAPGTPRGRPQGARPSPALHGALKCRLGFGSMGTTLNMQPGKLIVPTVSREHTLPLRTAATTTTTTAAYATGRTPLSVTLHKEGLLQAETGADSGIDITGLFDHSSSMLEAVRNTPTSSHPAQQSVTATSSAAYNNNNNTNHCTSLGTTNSGVKPRKRRNSSQLSNENKTHVISL